MKVGDRNRFQVKETGTSDVAQFFIQCHLREDLIHSRLDISRTLLTSRVERADRQAGEDQSMQTTYFHVWNWLVLVVERGENWQAPAL
jgi:hypothetical protein